jgi:hypothetical protein
LQGFTPEEWQVVGWDKQTGVLVGLLVADHPGLRRPTMIGWKAPNGGPALATRSCPTLRHSARCIRAEIPLPAPTNREKSACICLLIGLG